MGRSAFPGFDPGAEFGFVELAATEFIDIRFLTLT